MAESVIVLEQEDRMRTQRRIHRIPVDSRVREIDVEIRHHRPTLLHHVCRGRKILLLNILQLVDERFLRCTSRAGIPRNSTLIDHDREREPWMQLSFGHDQLRSLVL
ncbi:MAG: hypothetical protein LAO24_17840 [Acidobacteriia bacterium]|nr:hypothetical protein [Terriglobia bacterium]